MSGAGGRFHVVYSGEVIENFRRLMERARQAGVYDVFAVAAAEIHHRLTTDPHQTGDPLQDFTKIGVIRYHMIVHPLYVTYGVQVRLKEVFVSSPLLPLSGAL